MIQKGDVYIQISISKFCLSISVEHGLHIWSVTCNGTSTNLNTFKNEEFVFSHDQGKIVTIFKYPSRDYQIYAILDVCHMLKLAWNALRDLKHIIYPKENQYHWLLRTFIFIATERGTQFDNKLKSCHIIWSYQLNHTHLTMCIPSYNKLYIEIIISKSIPSSVVIIVIIMMIIIISLINFGFEIWLYKMTN